MPFTSLTQFVQLDSSASRWRRNLAPWAAKVMGEIFDPFGLVNANQSYHST